MDTPFAPESVARPMHESVHDDQEDRFALSDEVQIRSLFRRMIEQRSLMDAALPGSGPALLTTVLAIDESNERLILDASPDPAIERLALAQPSLQFATRIDRVDVRFLAGPLSRISWDNLPAYAAPMPGTVRYLQRREFFRINTPLGHQVLCQIVAPATENHPAHDLRARVNDISAGGLSLIVPPGEEATLVAGTRFAACRLMLPDTAPVLLGLRVRRLFRIGHRSGLARSCAGCEFVNLSAAAQTAIQRYMMRLERERIARERDRI